MSDTNGAKERIAPGSAKGRGVIYRDLSYQIVSCAFEVHRILGPGFAEKIYEQALVREFSDRKISCERQKKVDVFYKGLQVGEYFLDTVVEGKVVVELKAAPEILPVHCAQALSYLKASGLRLAIVLNFGGSKLAQKRIAF